MATAQQFADACRALQGARFHHHGRAAGHLDCAGIPFRGAWDIGLPVSDFLDYDPMPDEGVLLSIVRDRCEPREWSEWSRPGRLLVMRLRPAGPARHFAVSLGGGEAIHQESRARTRQLADRIELIHSTWLFRGLEP